MGMLDNSTKLAWNQAVTAIGDTPSTNILDNGAEASGDVGLAEELWLNCQVGNTAVTSGGAATVQPVLQTSVDGNTWAVAMAGPVVPLANLTANAMLWQTPLPLNLDRFLRVDWMVGVAALTAGTFTSFISLDVQRNIARPSGFTVQ